MLLVPDEEESLVLNYGSAKAQPVVLVAKRRCLCNGRALGEEGRGRCIKFVPIVIINRAMEGISAGLHHHIYGATGVASCLCARLSLCGKFVNRVDREDDTCNPGDAALIDRGNVVPQVVIVHTVNLPVHLIGASTIERAEAAHVVTTKARFNRDQLREVTSIQRNILNNR